MLPVKLKKAARKLGWAQKYGLLFGKTDGYVTSLADGARAPELFIDARVGELAPERAQVLRASCDALAQSYGALEITYPKTGVRVLLSKDKAHVADFDEFLYSLINQLKVAGVEGAAVCSNCAKKVERGVIVKVGARAHSCDAACAKKLTSPRKNAGKKTKRRVFAGFFGALFAGVVGLAPWLCLNYFGLYALPALFLVPLAASFGYRLFGGRPCPAKGVIVTLLSALLYAAGSFLFLCWSVYQNWWNSGYTFSRAELLDAVVAALRAPDAAMSSLLVNNVAAGAVFLLLGLLFVLPGAWSERRHYTAILSEE